MQTQPNAAYVIYYDGGLSVSTHCHYDPNTRSVSSLSTDDLNPHPEDRDVLQEEWIEYKGEEIRTFAIVGAHRVQDGRRIS